MRLHEVTASIVALLTTQTKPTTYAIIPPEGKAL